MSFNSKRFKNVFPSRKQELLKKLLLREGLSDEIRLLCSLSFLQAEGDSGNLKKILDLYIEDEFDFKKAYELLLQGYLFCGYPKAIESFFCLNEVLSDRREIHIARVEPRHFIHSADLMKRGETLSREVHKNRFEKIRDKISELCPDLGYLMVAEGYGHILSREGLDLGIRELAIVASLTSLNMPRQLNSHIRGARNVGCSDVEIFETIITGILWTEKKKIENSLQLWSVITGRKCPDLIDNIICRRV